MKRSITLLLLLFSFQCVFSQVHKFNAYAVAFFNEKTKKWDPFEDSNILISMNVENKKIKIYSKEIQAFDIIKVYDKTVDQEGDETIRFYCEDHNGSMCFVDFVKLISRGGSRQIYVRYDGFEYVYNVTLSD